jgi:ketosteroid isomerase-like protein
VPQENVELVRAIYSLWDNEESADHLIDPDIEFVNPPYAVEPGVRRGRTTFNKIREEMKEMWRDWRFEPERFVDAGEHVVVIGRVRGTSAIGVDPQWRQGFVYTIREGKAIRFRWFNQPSEALAAVGLDEG